MPRIPFSMCLLCLMSFLAGAVADDEPPSLSKSPFDVTGKIAGHNSAQPAPEALNSEQPSEGQPTKEANPELDPKQAAARASVERKIEPSFKRSKLTKRSLGERAHVDDYFVVALFNMPLATREAELRFHVTQGVEQSTDNVADYLQTAPAGTIRDFRVVARFKSATDAEEGVQLTRKKYDEYQQYQAQMLAYLKQMQAQSVRRC